MTLRNRWPGFMSDYVSCTGVNCHTGDGNCWGNHMTSWSKAQACRRTHLLVFWDLAFRLTLTQRLFLMVHLSQSSWCLHNTANCDICGFLQGSPYVALFKEWNKLYTIIRHFLGNRSGLPLCTRKLGRFVGRLVDELNFSGHWVKCVLLFLTDSLAARGKKGEVFKWPLEEQDITHCCRNAVSCLHDLTTVTAGLPFMKHDRRSVK
jgi:hypothetical protein